MELGEPITTENLAESIFTNQSPVFVVQNVFNRYPMLSIFLRPVMSRIVPLLDILLTKQGLEWLHDNKDEFLDYLERY